MNIIAHRGYWKTEEEGNCLDALQRALSCGFGVETDIRDHLGQIVIAHDLPAKAAWPLEKFFSQYSRLQALHPLALNVKADGLTELLGELLRKYRLRNYFFFDMSVPEALRYLNKGLPVYTRQSEYEQVPAYYPQATGVWLDEFTKHWINKRVVEEHLQAGKQVVIVSPELHQREYLPVWEEYHRNFANIAAGLFLCTDLPEVAREFFARGVQS